MHGHISKHVKIHRKPTGGTNKHDKHNIAQSGKGKGTRGATGITEIRPKQLHPNKASWALDVTKQDQPTEGAKHGKT